MKLISFDNYLSFISNDNSSFEKRIIFYGDSLDLFENISNLLSPFDLDLGKPIILWNFNYNEMSDKIFKNNNFIYNRTKCPSYEEIYNSFKDELFIPKFTNQRSEVKKLKFPIIAINNDYSEEFKTYNKFKKSEKIFLKFIEKIIPTNTFNILCFRNNPIHIEEQIGNFKFDIINSYFPFIYEIENIINKIYNLYKLDLYKIQILEKNNKLYLNNIKIGEKLSNLEQIKIYETICFDYYKIRFPKTFKKMLNEKYLVSYFKNKAYEAKLFKPKYGSKYKEYLN